VLAAQLALLACGLGVSIIGVDSDRIRQLQEALAQLGGEHAALRAQLLSRLAIARLHAPDPPTTAELSERALTEANRSADPDAMLAALNARHVALWRPDGLAERRQVAEQMISLAQRERRAPAELQARNWLCVDLWESGNLARFKAEAARHERLADALRLTAFRWYNTLWAASLAALEGRQQDAARLATEACDTATRAGDPNGEESRALLLGLLQVQSGEISDELLARNEELMHDLSTGIQRATAYAVTSTWLFAKRGRKQEAQALLDRFARDNFSAAGWHNHTIYMMFLLTDAAAILDDVERARRLGTILRPYAGRRVLAGRAAIDLGSVHYALARAAATVGDVQSAAAHYEQALQEDISLGARPWAIRTRVRYAEFLAARQQTVRADQLRRTADDEAHALGIPNATLSSAFPNR
jgi:hypothetical protein